MKLIRILALLLCFSPATAVAELRIAAKGFGIPEQEIRNLLEPTIQCFPKFKAPPLAVSKNEEGPIVLFERSDLGEIVIWLDTHDRYFSQYIYQFAHEYCHVLANFAEVDHENKWLEETLCETASLYALRTLSKEWKKSAPSSALQSYHPSLKKYADTIVAGREKLTGKSTPAFYQKHRKKLRASATERDLNGALAVVLLPLFEEDSNRWLTLQTIPRTKGTSLSEHLSEWKKQTPDPDEKFFSELSRIFLGKSSLPK